jgi:hypothetical protein
LVSNCKSSRIQLHIHHQVLQFGEIMM